MAPYTSTANETATSTTSPEVQAALILMRLTGRYTHAELEAAQGLALLQGKKKPNIKISTADYMAWKNSGYKTFTEYQVKKEAGIRAEQPVAEQALAEQALAQQALAEQALAEQAHAEQGLREDDESSLEEGEIREVVSRGPGKTL